MLIDRARSSFESRIESEGLCIIEDVLDPDFVGLVKRELVSALDQENEYHGRQDHEGFGMVLLCSLYGGSFLELFTHERLMAPFEWVLGEGCIVYAYTSSSMPPGSSNFANRIHNDCPRVIPGYITNMGATIALDHFTEENGATWYLPGSQTRLEAPSEDEFFSNAVRLLAPAGSACFFNARIWHYGGQNETDDWRHGLTINMARPWMKQRIDIPRAMAHMDTAALPDTVMQKLGFHAQVPADYDEFFAPPELRKFKQKAE